MSTRSKLASTRSIWVTACGVAHGARCAGRLRVGQRGEPALPGCAVRRRETVRVGREECLEELRPFTQEKNIHVRFAHVAPC